MNYDNTVRADDGSIVQFRFGDDSLDTSETQFLKANDETLRFMYENLVPMCSKLKVGHKSGCLDLSAEGSIQDGSFHLGLTRAPILHKQVKLMTKIRNTKSKAASDDPKVKAGCTVYARRPKRLRSFKNKIPDERLFDRGFRPATVIKVHRSEAPTVVDVIFEEDFKRG